MRLIDADVLIEQMDAEPEGGYYSPHDVISLLMTQPVVEERKKGEWLHDLLQDAIDAGIITENQASRLMDRIAEDNT